MAELEEGIAPNDIGDHISKYSQRDDDSPTEDKSGPCGYTPIFSTLWSGPYLGSLGAYPAVSDRVLEAKIWHPKGLLPTSILRPEEARLTEMDPWLREVVCRIHLVDHRPADDTYMFFSRIFVKFPKIGDEIVEPARPVTRPLIEANNIRVDFDRCPVVDRTGVRGHAKGLVTKGLLDRLDGTEQSGSHKQAGTFRRPHIEFHMYPSTNGFKVPPDFLPPQLNGINAACVEALKDIIFRNAKAAEQNLRSLRVPIRSPMSLQRRNKPERPENSRSGRLNRLRFNSQINLVDCDDDIRKPRSDSDLFAKVAPVQDIESDSTPAELSDNAAKLSDNDTVTTVTAEPQNIKTVIPDESDKAKRAKKSRGKKIRSLLTLLFCCVPKSRRGDPDQ